MSRRFSQLLLCLALAAACVAQSDHTRYLEITVPREVRSENLYIRYALAGDDPGGWVQPLEGVSSYYIPTYVNHRPAASVRAILYAPGCAIATLDLSLPDQQITSYPFVCQPVKTTSFVGLLTRPSGFYGHNVDLQMRYVAPWTRDVVTSIPMGDIVRLNGDGLYRFDVPDLTPDPAGEFQIVARDRNTDAVIARMIVTAPQSVRGPMGGLKLSADYPTEIVFKPCAADTARPHDAYGFATRPTDTCD